MDIQKFNKKVHKNADFTKFSDAELVQIKTTLLKDGYSDVFLEVTEEQLRREDLKEKKSSRKQTINLWVTIAVLVLTIITTALAVYHFLTPEKS